MPIGGFKGAGLALVMGILSSMLSGAAYGTELGDMERGPEAGRDGHFVAAIRVSAFEDVARFRARVDAAIREIHACRKAPGVERLYVPGEIEALRREAYLREGIPLNAVELADLARTARAVGVDTTVYAWLG
jgi:LDH2 family malate/lactate/ureidoglycolate dehydrogenase